MKTITFGYRKEGLALHQWAFDHTKLMAVVLPGNRLLEGMSDVIKDWAMQHKIPLLCQMGRDSQEFIDQIKAYNPSIILCHCYTYRLVKDILKVPSLGCINIHPGKLPRYPGRYPIEEALNNGETTLWVTLHFMDEGFDSGVVIAEASVDRKDNIELMRDELTRVGIQLLEKEWERLASEK